MNYLTPEIARHAKYASKKSLVKPSASCGIFQDCFDTDTKYTEKYKKMTKILSDKTIK